MVADRTISDLAAFERRAASSLRKSAPSLALSVDGREQGRSDDDLNPASAPIVPGVTDGPPTPAAVLVPVVERPAGPAVILTERAGSLRTHAGQIAFPGGRIDSADRGPAEAALREAAEEIGLLHTAVTILGYLDRYRTGTGYIVAPVVAAVAPDFEARAQESEVADVFEVPLEFLMDPANHQTHEREWRGVRRRYYAMPFGDRYIWGATAGMLKNLYDRLYG